MNNQSEFEVMEEIVRLFTFLEAPERYYLIGRLQADNQRMCQQTAAANEVAADAEAARGGESATDGSK